MSVPPDVRAAAQSLNVSRESWERIDAFTALLLDWQTRMNLIAPSTIPQVWHRHILDSLQLLPRVRSSDRNFADVGSGSGCPAIPFAIASGMDVHLYESIGKKAAFLREALRVTGTKGEVHQVRIEDVPAADLPDVQIVTARALTALPQLLKWTYPFFAKGARGLFHKGQDIELELTQATKSWKINLRKFQSVTDSRAVILEIEEVVRV
jgi:16S rRNA (guanine527-N7)-methyltransferase